MDAKGYIVFDKSDGLKAVNVKLEPVGECIKLTCGKLQIELRKSDLYAVMGEKNGLSDEDRV